MYVQFDFFGWIEKKEKHESLDPQNQMFRYYLKQQAFKDRGLFQLLFYLWFRIKHIREANVSWGQWYDITV